MSDNNRSCVFNKSVSVVFPAYKEAENIEKCVLNAHSILTRLVKDFEIIVVDDGSTDDTKNICRQLEEKHENIKLISKEHNEGYGFALRDGFRQSRFELVFFSDSDRQFDISNLRDLLQHIDHHDVVIGFRKDRKDSKKRKFLSCGFNLLVTLLFDLNVKDIDCAFKVFHRRVFDQITIESERFFVNTEILAKAKRLNLSIKEVGVSHFPRLNGISKVGFGDIPRTLKELGRIYRLLKVK